MVSRRYVTVPPAPTLVAVPEPFRNPLAPVAPRRSPTLLPLIGREETVSRLGAAAGAA